MNAPYFLNYKAPSTGVASSGVWISWPHIRANKHYGIDDVKHVMAKFVSYISRSEFVHINLNEFECENAITELLTVYGCDPGSIEFHRISTNDPRIRDNGPMFVIGNHVGEQQLAGIKWKFDGYGQRAPYAHDVDLVDKILDVLNIPIIEQDIPFEGSNIDINHDGIALIGEAFLNDAVRDLNISKGDVEAALTSIFNIKSFIWIKNGLIGDNTGGNLIKVARFVSDSTFIIATCNKSDANYPLLMENKRSILRQVKALGLSLEMIEVPLPVVNKRDKRYAASYTNFYLNNRYLLFPTFDCEYDRLVHSMFEALFPNRNVIGIPAVSLAYEGLGFHTLTLPIPAVFS